MLVHKSRLGNGTPVTALQQARLKLILNSSNHVLIQLFLFTFLVALVLA
jgi:hypothetical protein